MNKTVKKIAVTFVTALLICGVTVNAFALDYQPRFTYDYWNSSYFAPSPEFPNAESLPYGADTLIYEIYRRNIIRDDDGIDHDGWVIYRFFLKKDLYSGSDLSAFNGSTTCFVANSSNKFESFVASSSTVYYQTIHFIPNHFKDGGDYYGFDPLKKAPYYKTKNGKTYNFVVVSGDVSFADITPANKFEDAVVSNYSVLYGGKDIKMIVESGGFANAPSDEMPVYREIWMLQSQVKSYPSSSDLSYIQNEAQNKDLNNKISSLESNVVKAFGELSSSINNNITQAVNDILNAGSDLPSLDTDNSWMNDSLTKVNEWVSSIDAFKEQMQEAKEENAENMQQAKTFINGFFDVLPKPIIAILTLGLVVIVVVKVIGR